MARNVLIKSFFNDRGLDLRSSDLVRESRFASTMLNEDYRKSGALNKRKGNQAKVDTKGGAGLGVFANVNLTTGDITEELVTVDANLHKISDGTFTVTYTGSGIARMNLFVDSTTSTFHFTLVEDETTLLDSDLGTGIDEASVITLTNLKTSVDALTDFSAVIVGNTASPAAFLDISREVSVSSAGVAIKFIHFEKINSPLSSPLATTQTKINDDSFQNASLVNLQNVLYIGTGHDELYKYDGQTFFRAGMPIGVKPTTADGGAGSITNSSTTYIVTYIQKDNKNNIVEGIESPTSTALNLTSKQVDLTLTNIEDDTGFNTNCGLIAGAQSTINTITLDDGSGGSHTFKSGDKAYFFDSVSSSFVTRNITSVAATTITVDGAAVTVADNDIVSNNLKIAIYRNQSAGTTHSLVIELPNNSFATTQTHTDNVTDANLGANYVAPIKPHGLPPKGKYLTVHQNKLIIAGDLANVNTVYYSDDFPEHFPAGDNSFLVETNLGDKLTGVASNESVLFSFKNQSIHTTTGDLFNDDVRTEKQQGGDVGCISHHTIAEVKGKLYFLGTKGVFSLSVEDIEPEEVSFDIEPIFRDIDFDFNLIKATAINWFQKDKYMLFLPEETTTGSDKHTDLIKSKVIVYDYSRKAWLEWSNLDFQSGVVLYQDELYFSERRLGSVSSNVEFNLYRILDTGDTFDYADHVTAISFKHGTHWESFSEPDVFKKFLRLKMHSLDASINDFESETFSVDVETQLNYNDGQSSFFNLNFSSDAGWGLFEWGVEAWGSLRATRKKSKLKFTKALSIRAIFTNSILHENVLISGWTFETTVPYRQEIKE